MIDQLARALMPQKATLEQKAVTGPGAAVMSWGIPISDAARGPHQMMKDAQAVYARGNRWVKRAEMTISGRVGSVPWHLEIGGETVDDKSSPELRAIRDIFESPIGVDAGTYPGQPRTRREMWGLTSRHMGLCNVGFWYLDELNAAFGWPKRIFFVRPDRLTPNEQGGRLTGWTLDADQNGGTPLSLEEVVPFYLDPVDKGHFGTGLVESILTTTPLPGAIDRHAIDTLASGGRLPGIYSPKEAGTGDDVFDRMVGDLRTIKDMPDSSKRDVVARAPIDFTPTAADMASLSVIELSRMSRDDVLAHWGVPLSTIGGYTPAGMNSGETRKYDEAALWQNAVQFRIDAIYETVQYRLLDRLDMGIQLVIDSPEFDDDAPMYEKASKATNLPLTNNERRALVGKDPFSDPALGNAVWMPVNIVALAQAPEDMTVEEKAKLDRSIATVKAASAAKIKSDVARVLSEMGRDIASRVRSHSELIARKPGDADVWLPPSKRREWEAALTRVLNPHLSLAAETVAVKVEAQLGKRSGKADTLGSAVLTRLMKSVGKRITGIMDTTRDDVRKLIAKGLDEGMGAAELGDLIEQGAPFDEYRAELIARTETQQVLNEAALETYREYDVTRVVAIDGDDDEECSARDGQEYDLEDALSVSDHPNGTLDWSPVVGAV